MPRYKKGHTKANQARMANLRRGKQVKVNKASPASIAEEHRELVEANEEDISPADTALSMAERRADYAEQQLQEKEKQLKAVQHLLADSLDREKRLKCAAEASKENLNTLGL